MFGFLKKIISTANDRQIARYKKTVTQVNHFEQSIKKLTDSEMKGRIAEIKTAVQSAKLSLDDVLPEVFALVREAGVRTFGMRHFDVQILGSIALHKGFVTEMKTGEGKTLVATCPAVLNALSGQGVHVVTVNDYLAERDANWMRPLYEFLGLSVGVIINKTADDQRKNEYNKDIVYATNNELGFDYLRDNMKLNCASMAQREFNFAIIDEVDNILIDEARTPLIISGPAEQSSALYIKIQNLIAQLNQDDIELDKKNNVITLTEKGNVSIEKLLKKSGVLSNNDGLFDLANIKYVHYINQALRANHLYQKDKDYIVRDGQVIIIDEFTGRMSDGRRFSEGLHQALEAKERVQVQLENQTLASITYQNYFRLYKKLSGMTGTAETDAAELSEIYSLDVLVLPTNKPMVRKDLSDSLFTTCELRDNAVLKYIMDAHSKKQPILIGTTSIEESERIAIILKKNKIDHQVLNAKHHEKEADIIAQAGLPGAVTIATNMAGRGTDIILGGNKENILKGSIKEGMGDSEIDGLKDKISQEFNQNQQNILQSGGLLVAGIGRNESRRIDNQLRGRAGRQGDPGESKFFLSLDDNLLKLFLPENIRLKFKDYSDDGDISNPFLSRAVIGAQKRMEGRNFDIRKQLLRYDDVMNSQRKEIYSKRSTVMKSDNITDEIGTLLEEEIGVLIDRAFNNEKWDATLLKEELYRIFAIDVDVNKLIDDKNLTHNSIVSKITEKVFDKYQEKRDAMGSDVANNIEKILYLQIIDQLWKEHLLAMDHLRQGIYLRAYGQRDPLNEYKGEAFNLFSGLVNRIRENLIHALMLINPNMSKDYVDSILDTQQEDIEQSNSNIDYSFDGGDGGESNGNNAAGNAGSVISRNEPCVCGSEKKYKHCCGRR